MIDPRMGGALASPSIPQDGLTQALLQRQMAPLAIPQVPSQGLWAKGVGPQGPGGPPPPAPPPPPQGAPGDFTSSLMNTAQVPPTQPPNTHTNVPPANKRWENGQQIQRAYANNWQPNPVLLRASLGR
jgi:hypothetical protein